MSLSSSKKSMQTYLERHGIGPLFEDMMAKLIKEMPNEPINYLIDLLHKVNQNRFANECHNTYPSKTLYKSDMALTGSSIELKKTKDPQKILPGSKQPTSVWLESKREELSDDDEHVTSASRSYERPWLNGSKQIKDNSESGRCETPSWETDLKSRKGIDIVDQKVKNDVRKSWVSRSTSSLKESFRRKSREHVISDETNIQEKENNVPLMNYKNYSNLLSSSNNIKKKNKSVGDEVHSVESRPHANSKKTICSPQTYSKFKRKLSKKKSFENKEKLQALLATDQTRSSLRLSDDDSTDGEGEVFENSFELTHEGSRTKNSKGSKYIKKSSPDNLSICSKCSQPTSDSPKKSTVEKVLSLSDDDDNISSVSQLDPSKSYKPIWSPLPPGDENLTDNDISNKPAMPSKGILQKSKFSRDNNNNLISDFGNKMRNKKDHSVSNNKDNITDNSLTKSWRTKLKDDSESEPEDLIMKKPLKERKQHKVVSKFDTDL